MNLLSVVRGKVKKDSSYLHIIRQTKTRQSSARIHSKKYGDQFDRMLVGTWHEDFNNFVNVLSNEIVKDNDISVNEAKNIVIEGYKKFFATRIMKLFPELLNKKKNDSYKIINIIKKYIGNVKSKDNVLFSRRMPFYDDVKLVYEFLSSTGD